MSKTKEFAKSYKLRKKVHKDKMPGGKADKNKPSDFDKKQLTMGIKVEMEHTNDKSKAMEIAMDHLAEDSKYYTKLKTIHKEDTKKADQQAFLERRKTIKKAEKFVDTFKKSTYDFRDAKVSVDATQHAIAEATVSKELMEYLQTSVNSDLEKFPLAKGMLTLYRKEQGLYSGFFQNEEGQVVEKFDDMTLPILAKNLEVKELYVPASTPSQHDEQEAIEDMAIAADVAAEFIRNHNEVYHKGQEPGEPVSNGGSLRIKMGDIDIEIKKSINGFINDFKKSKDSKRIEVIKAIQSWRRNSVTGKAHKSNLEAAQTLLRDWDKLSEEFYQIMHAMKVGNE